MPLTQRQSARALPRVSYCLVLCGLLTAGPGDLYAQSPSAKATDGVALTLEGCLTREGRRGRSSAAEQFVLTVGPATPAPGGGTAAGTTSTGAAVPAPPQPKMYTLRSADDAAIDLPALVGHRVRVSGTSTGPMTTAPLAGRSAEATPYQAPVASPSTDAGATGTAFDTTNLPTLVVKTITSLAGTCP